MFLGRAGWTTAKGSALVPETTSGTRGEAADDISIWTATLDRSETERAGWEATLSPDELARANRFHFVKDRNHFVVARGIAADRCSESIFIRSLAAWSSRTDPTESRSFREPAP